MRILFVGMHNKPKMGPLDSCSRSGKLIDRVINALQERLDLFGWDFVKTNLYDKEYFPAQDTIQPITSVFDWAKRVEYTGDDIVIVLGQCVYDVFKKGNVPYIKLGHPSAVWSHEKQSEYITRAVGAVRNELSKVKF